VREYLRERRCPKCEGRATTDHQTIYGRSVMVRTCIGCAYVWTEAPLDAPTKQEWAQDPAHERYDVGDMP
jgi:hypothetical protein